MKKGFTIIEVLVVIGIIAVLTVIIFPAINNIRAKNRDAEKVADIAAIQLGLALYKNQQNGVYPEDIYNNTTFAKYVTADTLATSDGGRYLYVPLTRDTGINPKCTYYHLGVRLELSSGQIDTTDTFDSTLPEGKPAMSGYKYCAGYVAPLVNGNPVYGIAKPDLATEVYNYNVRP
jgi:prepilin-type N-terminal cleavage/methylation domain-containing protein